MAYYGYAAITKLSQATSLNKHVFLTVLKARKSKFKVLADSESGERSPPGLQTAVFLRCPPLQEGHGTLGLSVVRTRALCPAVGTTSQYHHIVCVHAKSLQSNYLTPWIVAHQASLSTGFSRQEYWSGLPCPPPGGLPDPSIKPSSLASLALAGRFFTTGATGEALTITLGVRILTYKLVGRDTNIQSLTYLIHTFSKSYDRLYSDL